MNSATAYVAGKAFTVLIAVFAITWFALGSVHKAVLLPIEGLMVRVGLRKLYFVVPIVTVVLSLVPMTLGILTGSGLMARVIIVIFEVGAFLWLWSMVASRYWNWEDSDGSFDESLRKMWAPYPIVCVSSALWFLYGFLLR